MTDVIANSETSGGDVLPPARRSARLLNACYQLWPALSQAMTIVNFTINIVTIQSDNPLRGLADG
jgi:hypothetical protein